MSRAPAPLHHTTWATLKALRAGARLSRNRHFYLFEDPRARRGIRIHRYLRSVVRDIEAHLDELTVERVDDGRYALRVEFPMLHGHRVAYLSEVEMALLTEEAPALAALLEGLATPEAPAPPA